MDPTTACHIDVCEYCYLANPYTQMPHYPTECINPNPRASTPVSESDLTNNLKVYPVPATDMLIIENLEKNKVVSLYNTMGMLLDQVTAEGNALQLDVKNYASGIYFIKVNGMAVQKFVKF